MTMLAVRHFVLNQLKKDTAFWHRILGGMYEATLGFKQYGDMELRIDKKRYKFTWFNYEWSIKELQKEE